MAAVDILKVSFEFSSKLGIRELPQLGSGNESNIKGLHVVGDLADAPIIKVALNQGYEVAKAIMEELKTPSPPDSDTLDVLVIGAGPAGIGAALALGELGAHYMVLEKERPFNTIQNFPKAKFIFSEPRSLENRGNFCSDQRSTRNSFCASSNQ
ncbi:MAG: NAD(P)-binding domain-containing protein, partial [Myxococcota bacterium]